MLADCRRLYRGLLRFAALESRIASPSDSAAGRPHSLRWTAAAATAAAAAAALLL